MEGEWLSRYLVVVNGLAVFYGIAFLPGLFKKYGVFPFIGIQFLVFALSVFVLLYGFGEVLRTAFYSALVTSCSATSIGIFGYWWNSRNKKK